MTPFPERRQEVEGRRGWLEEVEQRRQRLSKVRDLTDDFEEESARTREYTPRRRQGRTPERKTPERKTPERKTPERKRRTLSGERRLSTPKERSVEVAPTRRQPSRSPRSLSRVRAAARMRRRSPSVRRRSPTPRPARADPIGRRPPSPEREKAKERSVEVAPTRRPSSSPSKPAKAELNEAEQRITNSGFQKVTVLPKLAFTRGEPKAQSYRDWIELLTLQLEAISSETTDYWNLVQEEVTTTHEKYLTLPTSKRATLRMPSEAGDKYGHIEKKLRPYDDVLAEIPAGSIVGAWSSDGYKMYCGM